MTIDLTELFKVQNVLKERIGYKGPDHFDKLKLAMLVEVGECANEWRGFKFWSIDQKPRTVERIATDWDDEGKATEWEVKPNKNPLLEEYVDGLHFVMELGLVIHSGCRVPYKRTRFDKRDVTRKFNAIYFTVANLEEGDSLIDDKDYRILLTEYVELAEDLGFTWDQVEEMYYKKNAINHKRQAEGY